MSETGLFRLQASLREDDSLARRLAAMQREKLERLRRLQAQLRQAEEAPTTRVRFALPSSCLGTAATSRSFAKDRSLVAELARADSEVVARDVRLEEIAAEERAKQRSELSDHELPLRPRAPGAVMREAAQAAHAELLQHVRLAHAALTRRHLEKRQLASRLARRCRAIFLADFEKAQRERLQALKEHDMVKYDELIRETRFDRLKEFLDATGNFMRRIGHSANAEGEQDNLAGVLDGAADEAYFRRAHRIQEEVHQPSMMGTPADAEAPLRMRSYQLVGLKFLMSLYNNQLNGLLADEMGLGKTVQTIGLLCYLVEVKRNRGPFLVVVPLSTMGNWSNEFKRWAPSLRIAEYVGRRDTRDAVYNDTLRGVNKAGGRKYDVVLTTYEYCVAPQDKRRLARTPYAYIIVDEGHRVKNKESKLAQALSSDFRTARRLLLTGTPLQNNLRELWSLLHFIAPQVFTTEASSAFDQWFSKPFQKSQGEGGELEELGLAAEEKLLIVSRLHQLLRPFVLRRLKSDVATELKEKEEHVIALPLTLWQQRLYEQLRQRAVHSIDSDTGEVATRALNNVMMQLRKCCNHPFLMYLADRTFRWHQLPGLKAPHLPSPFDSADGESVRAEEVRAEETAPMCDDESDEEEVPLDKHAQRERADRALTAALRCDLLWRCSAKFEWLDRNLSKLLRCARHTLPPGKQAPLPEGDEDDVYQHRVLIFTQMTKVIDLLGEFFALRGVPFLRLDGNTSNEERLELLRKFRAKESPFRVFILSTRAGGQGINLQRADTVIIFDSDWNPQQDLQAQARAHRIGQKRQVKVFRLVTQSPMEQAVLASARSKLAMDAAVIQAGKFDRKTEAKQRRAHLRSVLSSSVLAQQQAKDDDDEEVEDEEEEEEQAEDEMTELRGTALNRVLARVDGEFEMYQQMDRDRERREKAAWPIIWEVLRREHIREQKRREKRRQQEREERRQEERQREQVRRRRQQALKPTEETPTEETPTEETPSEETSSRESSEPVQEPAVQRVAPPFLRRVSHDAELPFALSSVGIAERERREAEEQRMRTLNYGRGRGRRSRTQVNYSEMERDIAMAQVLMSGERIDAADAAALQAELAKSFSEGLANPNDDDESEVEEDLLLGMMQDDDDEAFDDVEATAAAFATSGSTASASSASASVDAEAPVAKRRRIS